eukprot:1402940-Lingulodinium_polyedra.AAC.1
MRVPKGASYSEGGWPKRQVRGALANLACGLLPGAEGDRLQRRAGPQSPLLDSAVGRGSQPRAK